MEPSSNDLEIKSLLNLTLDSHEKIQNAFSLFDFQPEKLLLAYQNLERHYLELSRQCVSIQDQLLEKTKNLDSTSFHLQSLLDHMDEGLIFINSQGLVTKLPSQSLLLLNFDNHPLPTPWQTLFKDDFFGFSISQHLINKNTPPASLLTLESKLAHQPTKYLHIHACYVSHQNQSFNQITKSSESTEGLMILMRDVSEIQSQQSRDQRNERLQQLGELTARLAHEIRNPLGAIEGFASLLARDLKNEPSKLHMVESIQEASHNLNHLVSQVLHYGRAISAHLITQDLVETVTHAVESALVSGWLKENQHIVWQKPAYSILIEHDKEMTQSCLSHLIKNAAESLVGKGTITLSIEKNEKQTSIQVIDTGHGIKNEDLEKIFTPLFSTKTEGNGLGLCEVNKMMLAQGAKVEVSSTVDKGSVFSLVFLNTKP